MTRDYGLNWVDQDKLFDATLKCFVKAASPVAKKALPTDPFLLVAQRHYSGSNMQASVDFEKLRSANKSLSNYIGNWHQEVLGLGPNWETTGSAGGGIDLKTKDGFRHPEYGVIYAEVKNRFNTIKSSDEAELWTRLRDIKKPIPKPSTSFLFQIVPKTTARYNKPWNPSGVAIREDVRHCDGATAYDMVFERKNALHDLLIAFPKILIDVSEELGVAHEPYGLEELNILEDALKKSFPDRM